MMRTIALFPFLAMTLSAVAYFVPSLFTPMKGAIVPLLMVIMFSMGVTLTMDDFERVLRRPRLVGFGVVLQYAIMPIAAFLVARWLELPAEVMAGLILVGCSPGGTASNVICYLARADVALSITLTTVSTLLAVVTTPVLTWLYVGATVPVPLASMLLSVLKIILIPVLVGVVVNTLVGRQLEKVKSIFPLVAVAAIVVIIAVIVALNQNRLAGIGSAVIAAVVLHNVLGLIGGYWIPRLVGCEPQVCRTIAIEVGMQNSGLAVALAVKYFSPVAALPGAIFSIWHNLSGSVLAGFWGGGKRQRGAPDR